MRKKRLLSGKKFLAGILAVGMVLGMVETTPEGRAYAEEPDLERMYFVDCGAFEPQKKSEGEQLGANQSVTDRIYGEDQNGKSWGVVVSETDQEISNQNGNGGSGVYTTYQWANQEQAGDAPKEDSFRYAHGQDTAGISPRYIKYRFDVDAGEYRVTVGMGNTWGNAWNPDVYAGTTGEKAADSKLNDAALNVPEGGHKEAVGTVSVENNGSLYVYALSEEATIQMNYIRVEKLPENVVTKLEVTAEPDKKEYFVGEELDTAGMELRAVYKNGDTKKVETGLCEITGFDKDKAGEQTITVSYTEIATVKASFAVTVKKVPIAVSKDPYLMYFVDCGDFDPETTSQGDEVSSSQSVTDRIYGEDQNGRSWGVVITETDQEILNQNGNGGLGVYTTYQWANQEQAGDAPKEDSFRYARGQDTAGITPRYIKYRFDVDAGEYRVTVGMGNTWGNAWNPDVYAGTTGEKDTDSKLNDAALNIPHGGHGEAEGIISAESNGSLYVYALSEEDTIQMNYIRIIKIPENVVTKLEITTEPDKKEYILGEELDVSGMKLQAVYKNGNTKEVPVNECEIVGFDGGKLGTQEITVRYTESLSVEAVFDITVKKAPIAVSKDPNLAYFVDCGDFDPETTSQGDEVSSSQSVTDRIYGEDQNGRSWGVVITETDQEILNQNGNGGLGVYTTYQWANQEQAGDAPKGNSFRYAHDQKQAGISPRYVKYRFDVDAGEYQVTVGMGNTWGNAWNPDIYAGMTGEKGTDSKLNDAALNIPHGGHGEAGGIVSAESNGSLYVYALSEEDTVQMNYIQIEKVPQNAIASLRIVRGPDKKEYEVGEGLDTAGMSIEAVYKDGNAKSVDISKCRITGFDSSRPGKKNVTVSYKEVLSVEAVFSVRIKPAVAVSDDPNLMYFVDCGDYEPETTWQGDAVGRNQSVTDRIYGADKNGKKWGVVTSDDGDAAIPIPEDAARKGSNAVYTTYQWANERQGEDGAKETSFRYAHGQMESGIQTRYVKYRFELEPGRYQVTVGVGNSWGNSGNPDIYAGMTGEIKKDAKLNDAPLAIPEGQIVEVQGRAAVAEGKDTLEVYVLSEEETIQVNYIKIKKAVGGEEASLKRLRLVPPQKLVYQFRESREIDTEGMLVYAIYQDGYERELSLEEYKITGFDADSLGIQMIGVQYTEGDVTARAFFEIIIVDGETSAIPEHLHVTPPAKTKYKLNETQELDTVGLEVTVKYSDGSEKRLAPGDYEVTGFSGSILGKQDITVSYTENGITRKAVFQITVEKDESEQPGPEDPGQEDPGQEDPGLGDPGQEDPGQEAYQIIYHDNNGGRVSGMPSDNNSYRKGEKAKVHGTPSSRTAFFAGWNTSADGKGESYAAGNEITVGGEVHLYAQWKKTYTAPNKLKYQVTGNMVVACIGTDNKKVSGIRIPATIKYNGITYKVTAVGAGAFARNGKIKTVTIGNNVKVIKARAFEKCRNLKNISIGNGLVTIEKYAFSGEKKGCVLKINSKKLKTVKTAINHKTKNMVIKVPKSKLKAYKKLFARKSGKVKVTAK